MRFTRFPACTFGVSSIALYALLSACAPRVELQVAPGVGVLDWNEDWRNPAGAPIAQSWSSFGSEQLAALITRARGANPDIEISIARIEQARGDLGIARSENGPTIDLSANASSDIRNLQGQTESFDRIGSVGIDVSYDLDLFGAAKASRRAAWARLSAAGYDQRTIELTIEADVASAYVRHSALNDRLKINTRALNSVRKVERIIRIRAAEGVASAIDVGIQSAEGDAIEVEISQLAEDKAIIGNAMAALVGAEAPGFSVTDTSLANLSIPAFTPIQPVDLLTRRPDIRAAEFRIAAADGNVANARAVFMPQIRLSADSFFDFAANGGIFNPGSSLSASVLASIFDRGRLKGRLTRAVGEQREAVANYNKALLTALTETRNALSIAREADYRVAVLERSRIGAERTAAFARIQYAEGGTSLNIQLEAERRLLAVGEGLIRAREARMLAAIALFRAIGGAPLS